MHCILEQRPFEPVAAAEPRTRLRNSPSPISLHDRLQARSAAILSALEANLWRIGLLWVVLIGAGAALRVGTSASLSSALPYLVLLIAPPLAMIAGLAGFRSGPVPAEVGRHPLYGANGLMLSLLLALLGSVALRAIELLTASPAVGDNAPEWLGGLHLLLTIDATVAGSLYALAFAAALRRSTWFPTALLAIWGCDLLLQLGVARAAQTLDLPANVSAALHLLLQGNATRVLVSLAIWLPYLLLSTRVAVTYRHRLPGRA